MKKIRTLLLGAMMASSFFAGQTFAQDGAALYASKACIACHGVEGKQPINDLTPKIAGQNKGYLVQQLMDFKSGDRSNAQAAQMKGIAAGLSEDEMKALAEYLFAL